jgi:hypothetical protein
MKETNMSVNYTRPQPRPIWSRACLDNLFELVKKKFGPYCEWKGEGVPGDDATEEGHRINLDFAVFCHEFGRMVGAKSLDAVGMKIVRAPFNRNVHGPASVAMATASALETGFIKNEETWEGNYYSRPSWYAQTMQPLLDEAMPRQRHNILGEPSVVFSFPGSAISD